MDLSTQWESHRIPLIGKLRSITLHRIRVGFTSFEGTDYMLFYIVADKKQIPNFGRRHEKIEGDDELHGKRSERQASQSFSP